MRTNDTIILEDAYELIRIKQFLLSEGYSKEEIEQAITEGRLGEFLQKAKKAAANVGVAATLGATALGFGNSLANNPIQPQEQPKISMNSKIAAENPIYLQAYKNITGKDFQNQNSEFGTMYVIYKILSKVGGNGGVEANKLADSIKTEINENPNSVNTEDINSLNGVVKLILAKTENLPKQQSTGGKFGSPVANKQMLNQLR